MDQVVFEVAAQGPGIYGFTVIGVVGAVIGWALAFRPAFYAHGPPHLRLFGKVVLGFSLAWIVVAIAGTAWRQHDLVQAMSDGRVAVVEGVVADFVPMSPGCHAPERFRVGGHQFAYRDCEDTGGFNRSSIRGGPVRPGQHVRVTYDGDRILKLEILGR